MSGYKYSRKILYGRIVFRVAVKVRCADVTVIFMCTLKL